MLWPEFELAGINSGSWHHCFRPVLVLRPLSCGSCTVYIISIATDDVTERVMYIHSAML